MKTFRSFSERFYLTILGLIIPFSLLLYGASGHQFRLEAEARNGMIIILTGFIIGILYFTTRRFKGKEMTILKYLFGLTLVVTLVGGIGILWSMISFEWGDDIELLVQVLFYLIPSVFILSIINIGYWLFKDQNQSRTFILKNKTVILKSFNGVTEAQTFTEERENYWKLIGQKGEVIENRDEDDRVLVLFEINLDEMKLENHNAIKNSLWIKGTDLKFE
jgi:hypothetical protein